MRSTLGFAGLCLGFLTVWAVLARADSVGDALRCLDEQRIAEASRDRLLAQADSLGGRIALAGASVPEAWLRRAEAIQHGAMDRELDLLVAKDRCRRQAVRALKDLERRLTELDLELSSGRGDEAVAEELLLGKRTRADLLAILDSPAILKYPDLLPDDSDTQETLQAKLQYYRDVEDYLQRVDQRLNRRARELEAEQRVLEEAGRFIRDLTFLDEGGRVSADGSVRLRGAVGVPGGGGPGGGQGRPTMELPSDARSASLEFALRASPSSPEESERLQALLSGYRRDIALELGRIAERTQQIEARILPGTNPPK